ncbi:MAG: DUF4364 family protein [Lachnospiraceae bacterium]|nr:DUF4364 family protein [Lachnospiraceae bacterium]
MKNRDSNSELYTSCKLMILYMLDNAGQFMTKASISDFILGQGYVDYFELNLIINEMIDTELIRSQTKRNHINLEITEEGERTLAEFQNRITAESKKRITDYLLEKEYDLRNKTSVQSNYYKNLSDSYTAELFINENNSELVSVKLQLPSEENAIAVCRNWEKKSPEIYKTLMQQLL